ncbi:ATP-dependent nuclease [Metabacillus flavus]|uniref:ATP-dependent nuclease n=1 Tax=Metabacillus flavus TaxID=2823519 RepID=UPI002015F6B3|nr:AAA family ATPase [Metabacillus flavus]
MYLKSISLTNFRQFGMKEDGNPGITVFFNSNFNVLVGENDAGKTAITDAIRYLLGSVSDDFEKINQEDFYCYDKDMYSDSFYIEGIFTDLSDREAGTFLEWLSFDEDKHYQLRVCLSADRRKNENGKEYIDRKVQAGDKNFEYRLDASAKNLLKTTYLKPMRDAQTELKPGIRSRLAYILKAHPAFNNVDSSKDSNEHQLVTVMKEANNQIESYFREEYADSHSLVGDIETLLSDFYDIHDKSKSKSRFTVSRTDLTSILRKLSLENEDINLGLGNLNLLFIAAELLLLNNLEEDQLLIGPNITLIEEIEAHLHTQAQIRLIKYLEEELDRRNNRNQFILTSHSPNLVASIDPKFVILMHDKTAYPLDEIYTKLDKADYGFIERFLDSTKSNLFFAKGVIFVEGDSEMLLLPAIANLIGYPLHKHGISLVNVQGTSFERYIKLFSRSDLWLEDMDLPAINLPLSIITDLDVKAWTYYETEGKIKSIYAIKDINELNDVLAYCDEEIEDIDVDKIGQEYSTVKKLVTDFGFNIDSSNEDLLTQITKKDITPQYLDSIEKQKFIQFQDKYNEYSANISVNVAPKWTLEYSLALSELAPLLLKAVHEVRYKNPIPVREKSSLMISVEACQKEKIERKLHTRYLNLLMIRMFLKLKWHRDLPLK